MGACPAGGQARQRRKNLALQPGLAGCLEGVAKLAKLVALLAEYATVDGGIELDWRTGEDGVSQFNPEEVGEIQLVRIDTHLCNGCCFSGKGRRCCAG